MPDYKKKKVRRIRTKKGKKPYIDNIPMTSSDEQTQEGKKNTMRVVKGKKLENRRRMRAFLSAAVILCIVIGTLSFVLPVGLGENISNILSVAGMGEYPFELYGAETIDSFSRGNYYYILTDTELTARSNNGKNIFSHSHGFSKPALRVSETRALIFDQGGSKVDVFNLKEITNELDLKGKIITADISRSGTFAVAVESDTYASTVTVYDKRGRQIYKWNSAKELINNITLSPSGKKLAVSTISAETGEYVSNLYVLEYDSADPSFSKKYGEDVILSLDGAFRSGFSLVSNKEYSFVNWSDYTVSQNISELEPAMYRRSKNGYVLVFNRSGDRSDNKIMVFDKKGEKLSEIDFDGFISDISYAHGHIYCISDTVVYMMDKQGEVVRKAECGYGSTRLAVIGTYGIAAITSGEAERIELKQESAEK